MWGEKSIFVLCAPRNLGQKKEVWKSFSKPVIKNIQSLAAIKVWSFLDIKVFSKPAFHWWEVGRPENQSSENLTKMTKLWEPEINKEVSVTVWDWFKLMTRVIKRSEDTSGSAKDHGARVTA